MAKEWGPDPDKAQTHGPRKGGRGCAVIVVALLGAAAVAIRAAVEVFT